MEDFILVEISFAKIFLSKPLLKVVNDSYNCINNENWDKKLNNYTVDPGYKKLAH